MNAFVITMLAIGAGLTTIGGGLFVVGAVNNNKNSEKITNEYQLEEDFSNIDINLETADLEFKPSLDGTKKVICEERNKRYHEVKIENDTLSINSFDTRKWYEHILNFDWKPLSVTVYLPNESYVSMNIKSATGDIKIPDNYIFENLNIESDTGDILLDSKVTSYTKIETATGNISLELETKNLAIESATGNVNLSNSKIEENVNVLLSTGNVNFRSVTANNIDIKVSTGGVLLNNTISDDYIKIDTSTGDVEFEDIDATNLIDVETGTGDVEGTILTGKNFLLSTATGRIKPISSTTGGGTCKVKTGTGDILLSLKE